jgi:hypothetical protein
MLSFGRYYLLYLGLRRNKSHFILIATPYHLVARLVAVAPYPLLHHLLDLRVAPAR